MNLQLLQELLQINSASGNEVRMKEFILDYFKSGNFKVKPTVLYGDGFQDCIAVVFGEPRSAAYAHMDTVGFMVRYDKELVEIGSPDSSTGTILIGTDAEGEIECSLVVQEEEYGHSLHYNLAGELERGTELFYKPDFKKDDNYIYSPYLDNRIGILNLLELAKELENGVLVFTCWEEHQGGSAGMMAKFLYDKYKISQALISDITWTTVGVTHEQGAVISLRDVGIPRRSYVNKIVSIAKEAGIRYQLEVESTGGSDGTEIQKLSYPIDWCFVGAPCSNMHSPSEKVNLKDVEEMMKLYKVLMQKL